MIVVVGSTHDPVAVELTAGWGARLCTAEDLTRPGWRWAAGAPTAAADAGTWAVDGAVVDDAEVTGVFVRRATVYADELTGTHADDRAYLAAELHAFLVHVLHRTGAAVVNPVDDGGAFGEAVLRPERWLAAAAAAGVEVAPLRLRSDRRPRRPTAARLVEVVDGTPMGSSGTTAEAAVAACGAAGLRWGVAAFDGRGRLSALTTTRPPSAEAAARLGEVLARGRAA